MFLFFTANLPPVLSSPLQAMDLEISIHYRKREMLKVTYHTARLQLHYLHEALELEAHHICFPSTESLLDHKQVLSLSCCNILSVALIYVEVFLISTSFIPDWFHQPHPEQHPEGSSPGGAGDRHLRLQAGQVPCVRQHQWPQCGSPRPKKASPEHHGGAPQLWEVCEW